jgi:hypothetical protein
MFVNIFMIYEDTTDYQRYMQFTANPRQPSPYYTTKLVPPHKRSAWDRRSGSVGPDDAAEGGTPVAGAVSSRRRSETEVIIT